MAAIRKYITLTIKQKTENFDKSKQDISGEHFVKLVLQYEGVPNSTDDFMFVSFCSCVVQRSLENLKN